jgi:hypothetical protein
MIAATRMRQTNPAVHSPSLTVNPMRHKPRRNPNAISAYVAGTLAVVAPLSVSAANDASICSAILAGEKSDIHSEHKNYATANWRSMSQEDLAYASEQFFSESEGEAFAEYQKAYNNETHKDMNISGEGHYGFIGGAASFANSYDHKLSQQEFSAEYNKHKEEYAKSDIHMTNNKLAEKSGGSSTGSEGVADSTRDKATVDAWKDCVALQAKEEPGLYASGYRGAGDGAFVTVAWEPGPFAAAAPRIEVSLKISDSELEIDGDQTVTLTTGSGTSFGIRYRDEERLKEVIPNGITVLVNGSITDENGELIVSQQASAEVPGVQKRPLFMRTIPVPLQIGRTTVMHLSTPPATARPSPQVGRPLPPARLILKSLPKPGS